MRVREKKLHLFLSIQQERERERKKRQSEKGRNTLKKVTVEWRQEAVSIFQSDEECILNIGKCFIVWPIGSSPDHKHLGPGLISIFSLFLTSSLSLPIPSFLDDAARPFK